jgi:DNA-binding response OmpR family regulator
MPSPAESPITILVIEDDDRIAEPLIFGLRREGYAVLRASDGRQGLDLARTRRPQLLLLDVMLPGMDGFDLCRALRQQSAVPIIMLTARGEEMERVMGLELGADDYIVKPFSFKELLARVRAVLRRRTGDQEPTGPDERLVIGDITLDRMSRQVWRRGRIVGLRQREFEMLVVLMERVDRALSRQELLDLVWGPRWVGDPRTVDVHIRWLREKLEDDPASPRFIHTVRGYGYRLVDPNGLPAEPP